MNKLELPVGGVFAYTKEGEIPRVLHNVRVVEEPNDPMAQPCEGCIFVGGSAENCKFFACLPYERTDGKNVKFLEVKGGGDE